VSAGGLHVSLVGVVVDVDLRLVEVVVVVLVSRLDVSVDELVSCFCRFVSTSPPARLVLTRLRTILSAIQ